MTKSRTEYAVRYTGFRHGKTTVLVDTAHDPADPEQAERLLEHIQEVLADLGEPCDARIVTRTTTTTEWA